MNWFASQCRKVMYNMAFGTQFRYFGKACTLEINGQVKIGKNVYIGDHVSLIVEQGAILEIADHSFIGESCYIKCFGGKVSIGQDVSINSKSFIKCCTSISFNEEQSLIICKSFSKFSSVKANLSNLYDTYGKQSEISCSTNSTP